MSRLRVLALAPDANPDSISTALGGYELAAALARCHDVTLAVRSGYNERAVRRAGAPFEQIEGVRVPALDKIYAWSLRRLFRYDYGSHALTAFTYPFAVAFEWCAWRQLRPRITAGAFDVVIRLLPVTSVLPSAFAFLLRKTRTPFVVGPVNGGLPWPTGFPQVERQKEWVSGLRNVYRVLPFSRSTYGRAAAIIAGSSCTAHEFDEYRDKVFFVPENGIEDSTIESAARSPQAGPLRLMFVGRLVPYKACDLAIRGAARLLREGRALLTVVGDGPERNALERLAETLGVAGAISFRGWLSHPETLACLRKADVLVFPSLREFGGGVVFEALARGVVPIVARFGGPGDIVTPAVGFAFRLTNEADAVTEIDYALDRLERDRLLLQEISARGLGYAKEHLTWQAKARTVSSILMWTAGRGAKPDLPPPNRDAVSFFQPVLESAPSKCQESSAS
ncbi:MAG: glycosyltransferase family 4 protein [Vicinamibacterales bacterium]